MGAHDVGGQFVNQQIDQKDHDLADWEMQIDALYRVLLDKGLITSDELRRGVEALSPEKYISLSYYERWSVSLECLLTEKFIMATKEIDEKVRWLGL